MSPNIYVTFLGTSSGGGPSQSRNCSSLVSNLPNDGSLWMVDCAEGTYRQFDFQPQKPGKPHLRAHRVSKMFITHMHADHIMGIITILRNILFPPPAGKTAVEQSKPVNPKLPAIEIYGPAGIRTFVRQNLKMTLTKTSENYVVHELLAQDDPVTPCDMPEDVSNPNTGLSISQLNVLHCNENPGRDIRASPDGLWHDVLQRQGRVRVDVGPIHHRDPCLGYIFTETGHHQRKLVILGDTYDPSPIEQFCHNPSPSLLIHEATDAHIPRHADPAGKYLKRTHEGVRAKALLRGHSVPEMAGAFAKKVGAEMLVLNHISGRFPASKHPRDSRHVAIEEIENQATSAWGMPGKRAIAAYDFLDVKVPIPRTMDVLEQDTSHESTENSFRYTQPRQPQPCRNGGNKRQRR